MADKHLISAIESNNSLNPLYKISFNFNLLHMSTIPAFVKGSLRF